MTTPTPTRVLGSFDHRFGGRRQPRTAAAAGRLVVLTDRSQVPAGRDLLDVVGELAEGLAVDEAVDEALVAGTHGDRRSVGPLTVILREKDLDPDERTSLAAALVPIVHAAGGFVLVATGGPDVVERDADLAAAVGADGLHLPAPAPTPRVLGSFDHRFGGRRPPRIDRQSVGDEGEGEGAAADDRSWIVGRSCHTIDEVRAAAAEGLDHVTLSPVLPTPSKPGYGPALGFDGLAAAIRSIREGAIDLRVMALGGITPADADTCLSDAVGADAVAVMGSAMADPAAWVAWAHQEVPR